MELTFAPDYAGPQPGSSEQVTTIITTLRQLYPDAKCTLNFSNPLELLIATQLSAQCTDERVNLVTTNLFQKYKCVDDFTRANQVELEQDIRSTGFYHNKAKNILSTCQRLIIVYGSEVPRTMPDLMTLPGVARKTANVVLGNAFGIVEGIVVDTHVRRLAQRFGWTQNTNPVKVEQDLMCIIPQPDWLDLSHLLILHGRTICTARYPLCEQCALSSVCPSSLLRPLSTRR